MPVFSVSPRMQRVWRLAGLLLLCLLAGAGCAARGRSPAVPTATLSVIPTATPTLAIVAVPTFTPTPTAIPTPAPFPEERRALVELYQATQGSGWATGSQDHWLSDASLDTWLGVTTNAEGRVTALQLQGVGLRGKLPAGLGQLTALEHLSLAGNHLQGEIPAPLGQLSALREIYLAGNDWTGCLPPAWRSISFLQGDLPFLGLPFCDSDITGPYASQATHMNGLYQLRRTGEKVTATFSTTQSPVARTAAQQALLFVLPEGYRPATVANRDVEGFAVQPGGPFSPRPTELRRFRLRLEPEGPVHYVDNIGLARREHVAYTVTVTWGTTLAAGDQAALEALYAKTQGPVWNRQINWLVSELPLGGWYGVTTDAQGRVLELDLKGNGLAGPLPSALGDLTALRHLDLSYNLLFASLPPALGQLSQLKSLVLSRNRLGGHIPRELGQLTALQELLLSDNKVSGPIPPALGQLTVLERLVLDRNRLSGPIPPELGQLPALRALNLHWNMLSGSIPPELGQLTALERLVLERNRLSGPIPPELGQLTALEWLNLSYNHLSGSIPAELGQLTALESLNLSYNQLSGSIPAELGQLTALEWLNLSYNQLSGSIPPELGALPLHLWYGLNIHGNQWTGCLPPSWSVLVRGLWETLDLEFCTEGKEFWPPTPTPDPG